eukprot:gene12942-5973_t
MPKIRTLDLFSGIGGHALALRDVAKPVAYCEIDPFSNSVLLARMEDGQLPKAPVFDDVRTLNGKQLQGRPTMITASFLCQDVSIVRPGKKLGIKGNKSGLYFQILRLVDELADIDTVLMENSPNIRNVADGLKRIESDFKKRGFKVISGTFAASDVGARHIRRRWYCLAVRPGAESPKILSSMSHPYVHNFVRLERSLPRLAQKTDGYTERIQALVNAVVPQVVTLALRVLSNHALYGGDKMVTDLDREWDDDTVNRVKYPLLEIPDKRVTSMWPTPVHSKGALYVTINPVDKWNQNHHNFATRVFHDRLTLEKYGDDIISLRGTHTVNPTWTEALMGFPKNWTKS